MDMEEFIKSVRSDSTVNSFLCEVSDELEEKHFAPSEISRQYLDVPGWLPVAGLLLWFALPWIKLGLEVIELKRLEVEKHLKERAQEQGIDPRLLDKAVSSFLDKLILSLGSDKLKSSLRSVMDQVKDENNDKEI